MNACSSRYMYCQLALLEIFPRLSSFGQTQPKTAENDTLYSVDILAMYKHALSLTSKYPSALFSIGLLVNDRPNELHPKISQLFDVVQQTLQNALHKYV